MMKLILFAFLLSSCINNKIEIYISEKYEGPVVIVEDYSRPEITESRVKIDSIGLTKSFISPDKTAIEIYDENNTSIKQYQLSQGDLTNSNDRMIFGLGQTSMTNPCAEKEMDYISFYVGTYKSYKEYSNKYENDELLYFEKNGISFCDFLVK